MTDATTSPPERSTYRHGDLRRALLEAGIQLARAGGPDAVVLREATRRAGVVPNAAYRHFASRWELLQAVRSADSLQLKGMQSGNACWIWSKRGYSHGRPPVRSFPQLPSSIIIA